MATLKDVSKETGLSIGTISRILNNRGYISDEARAKVNHAMAKLNYEPNELARSLSKQSSAIIALIVPSISNPYFAQLARYIEEIAGTMNYQILLMNSGDSFEKEPQLLTICKKHRVSGIILCSGHVSTVSLKKLNIPVVTIERYQDEATASIECDNYQGGKLAAEHLIERGAKNLLIISSVQGHEMPADKRSKGFIETAKKEGVEYHDISYSQIIYENMEYTAFISNLLDTFPKTDGIFCSNDIAATQAIQVCHEKGLKIPEDIKIIGFDDIPFAKMTSPSLTTIHQPIREMAHYALISLVNAKSDTFQTTTVMMSVSLIKRNST